MYCKILDIVYNNFELKTTDMGKLQLHPKILNMILDRKWKEEKRDDYYIFLTKDDIKIKVAIETGNIVSPKDFKEKI